MPMSLSYYLFPSRIAPLMHRSPCHHRWSHTVPTPFPSNHATPTTIRWRHPTLPPYCSYHSPYHYSHNETIPTTSACAMLYSPPYYRLLTPWPFLPSSLLPFTQPYHSYHVCLPHAILPDLPHSAAGMEKVSHRLSYYRIIALLTLFVFCFVPVQSSWYGNHSLNTARTSTTTGDLPLSNFYWNSHQLITNLSVKKNQFQQDLSLQSCQYQQPRTFHKETSKVTSMSLLLSLTSSLSLSHFLLTVKRLS